jgi:hypothetical protein
MRTEKSLRKWPQTLCPSTCHRESNDRVNKHNRNGGKFKFEQNPANFDNS